MHFRHRYAPILTDIIQAHNAAAFELAMGASEL